MSEATKRPWRLCEVSPGDKEAFIEAGEGDERLFVTVSLDDRDRDVAIASAELLVRAVNSFDELVHALSDLLAVIAVDEPIPESVSYMKAARSALQKATEGGA